MSGFVFVSYATEDRVTANTICEFLENSGIRCWMAPRNILPGSDWGESIIEAINQSRLMVLIYSESAGHSIQIKREVERASSKRVPIVPFRIDDIPISKSLELHLSDTYWIDAISDDIGPQLQLLREMVEKLTADPLATDKANEGESAPTSDAAFPNTLVVRRRRSWLRSRKAQVLMAFAVAAVVVAVFFVMRSSRKTGFEHHLDAAQMHMNEREFDLAIEESNAAIASDPNNWLGYRMRGDNYGRRGGMRGVMSDFSLATADLNTAVKLNPKDDIAWQMLGQVHGMLREWDQAESALSTSLKLNPRNVESWISRAGVYQQKQNYRAAASDLNEALEWSPNDSRALGSLGDVYILTGDYQKAVEKYSQAIKQFPNNPVLRLRRSEAYAGLGMTKEAEADRLAAQKR
jgi:tetratricopeptide (TPR) repeat protein